MKKILLFTVISVLVITSVIAADLTLNIFKTNHTVQRFAVSVIDSVVTNNDNTMLQIYKNDGVINSVALSDIDSMNYSSGTYSLPVISLVSTEYDKSLQQGICEVNISVDGGCELIERGVCWSGTSNPTINDNYSANGINAGRFYSVIPNLVLGRKYYVRAFATNCMGTVYSNTKELVALPGNVTYTLDVDSATYPQYYNLLTVALDSACYYYNRYTSFKANIYVYYNAGIQTAQASYHGAIGYGSDTGYMWVGTTMHEMAHYFGSGTTTDWKSLMVNGVWQGKSGQQLCKQLTGAILKGDNNSNPIHYWPTGINYRSEVGSVNDLINHAKIIQAMLVEDCGLPSSW
ncbi:MAG: hypothetical protein JW717_06990 [Marinilabiliaceae bacterium]|nr:hypothetical protein [Marinilabiliaceae bacterium]